MTKTVMQTYSGGPFDALKPKVGDIRLLDIAEALSKINRFNGHTVVPYSVAQHCIVVSGILDKTDYALEGLMHDASEAYTGDITSPVKAALRELAGNDIVGALEEPIQEAISQRFGLVYPLPPDIHRADMEALAFERRCVLHPSSGVPWGAFEVPPEMFDGGTLNVVTATEARDAFIARFQTLMLRRAVRLRDVKRAEYQS